jgi:hypothetical protein
MKRQTGPHHAKPERSEPDHVQPNQGLHIKIMCKQTREHSMAKVKRHNLLFLDFVHHQIF